MSTVTGSVGGQPVTYTTQTQSAAQVAQAIINMAGTVAVSGNTTLSSNFFVATGGASTITGGSNIAVGVLTGQNSVFQSGASQASYIVAGDNTNSAIVNNNPGGSLIAFTGEGGNALVGDGVVNGFQTGNGGSDAVQFDAGSLGLQVNVLTSLGQDAVTINGSTTGGTQVNAITAANNGTDSITLNNGASLTFTNNGAGVSTVVASSGSTVNIGGTGSTSVVAGGGAETFSVSTASGNVTLQGANGGIDTFDFVRASAGVSTAVDVVTNFSAFDSVNLSGYGAGGYTAAVVNGSTVLTLSDNTKIIFAGVTDPNQVTSRLTSS